MFDKIKIIDGVIVISKGLIEYNGHAEYLYNEQYRNNLIKMLNAKNIHYIFEQLSVPLSVQKYDGISWPDSLEEAILYINEVGKYNPLYIKVEELKQQLSNMDYKTSKYADGDYTDKEWQQIVAERKALRKQIRDLETQIG